jgi:GT2 family glycosyltransferase
MQTDNMPRPLVSVIVRTRNRRELLPQALASVQAQTWRPLELVVVNDGGVPVADLLPPAGDEFSVVGIDLERCGGRSNAANRGLDAARGDWLIFLDDDDWFDADHIETLVGALTAARGQYLAAYSAVRCVADGIPVDDDSAAAESRAAAAPVAGNESSGADAVVAAGNAGALAFTAVPEGKEGGCAGGAHAASDTARTGAGRPAPATFAHPFDPVRLLVENYIPIHAMLFSRVLPARGCRFDRDLDRFEDWDFWLQALRHTNFLFVDHCSAVYRTGNGSGFGRDADTAADGWRLALYRKWAAAWSDGQLLRLLERARQYPEIAHLEGVLADRVSDISRLLGELHCARDEAGRLSVELLELQQDVRVRLEAANRQITSLYEQFTEKQRHIDILNRELHMIHASRSWRLTRPLRLAANALMILRTQGAAALAGRIRERLVGARRRMPPSVAAAALETSYHPLEFPRVDAPLVSIVIPVYNQHLHTFHCLKSILAAAGEVRFEVIVVDDCSTDDTAAMLAGVSGISKIRNPENRGFIRTCNTGAAAARGEYIVFLNNDTEVKQGWLEALTNTFSAFPDAGMVGARLVYPDGSLQEAGGIVWQDGSAWNFGRGDDPARPEYSWCRQVDYCSGACLMIPQADFRALGGFDTAFAPAYYEDVDLAFRVRAAGKKVYYQPRATVIHFEGVTSGTDTGGGVKRYQVVNAKKFFDRWRETLAGHRPNGSQPYLEKERGVKRRLLVVDARVLMPDHDAGSVRMNHILRIFQRLGYKVTFIPDNLEYHERYTAALQAAGIECWYAPYVRSVGEHLKTHGRLYDVVMLSRADVAEKNLAAVRQYCPEAKVLFDTVDLHFLREEREAQLHNDPLRRQAARLRKAQELGIARQVDMTLLVSTAELEIFRREAPDVRVALLPTIQELPPLPGSALSTESAAAAPTAGGISAGAAVAGDIPGGKTAAGNALTLKGVAGDINAGPETDAASPDGRRDILFIGGFEHPPNLDAMEFFIGAVLPLITARRPDIRLLVVGSKPPARLRELAAANANVEVRGYVADIAPLFREIRLTVAPLRYGAGVKGKINTSMAWGVPVVATGIAAEGMDLEDGRDVLLADTPEDFADRVLRLYEDDDLWRTLSRGGRENIRRRFSPAVAEQQVRLILGDVSN